jgi:RHS repeat-associated protein
MEDVLSLLKSRGYGTLQSGRALIKAGYSKVTIPFKTPFTTPPLLTATPISQADAKYYLSDIKNTSFRIRLTSPSSSPLFFNWFAMEVPNDDGSITESEDDMNGISPEDLNIGADDPNNVTDPNTTLPPEIPETPVPPVDPINGVVVLPTHAFTSPQAATKRGSVTYAYDARGNMTSENIPVVVTNAEGVSVTTSSITTHTWNAQNMLVSTTLPNGDVITYRYSPDGNRVSKKLTNSAGVVVKSTIYMDDDYESEENGSVTINRTRVMLGSVHVATIEKQGATKSIYYQLTNTVGSSTITTDTAGAVIQAQDTKPYGGYRINVDSKQTAEATGIKDYYALHERDQETLLTYMNARMYDEKAPMFLSLDPTSQYNPSQLLSDPQQLNLYAYARGNPVRYNDPSGQDAVITVNKKNKTITIRSTIYIHGKGATKDVASRMQKNISKAWNKGLTYTDKKTDITYSVNFKVKVKTTKLPSFHGYKNDSNVIKVEGSENDSYVTVGAKRANTGHWRENEPDPAPHEFGHLIGLKDRYIRRKGAEEGWEGNIMAEAAMRGEVQQRNIDAVVEPYVERFHDRWFPTWNNESSYHIAPTFTSLR